MAGVEGPGLRVGSVEARREAAEEAAHGEIDLPVPDVDGGVDEDGVASACEEDVAGPEVAVQERRAVGEGGRAEEAARTVGGPLDKPELPRGDGATGEEFPGEGEDAAPRPKVSPVVRPAVRLRQRADDVVTGPSPAPSVVRPNPVQSRQFAPEPRPRSVARPPRRDPLQ